MDGLNPLEVGLALARMLERRGVACALGGALAYGLWGVPRATKDVDINVFVDDGGLVPVFAALEELGCAVDVAAATRDAREGGLMVVWRGRLRIDVFTNSVPFCEHAHKTRVMRTVLGQDAWFLSAEALCVFKLMFFRPKDVLDLERLVQVQGPALDRHWVRAQLLTMVDEADDRVKTWDQLVRG